MFKVYKKKPPERRHLTLNIFYTFFYCFSFYFEQVILNWEVNHQLPMPPLYRNQLIDFECKSIECFLYDENIGC